MSQERTINGASRRRRRRLSRGALPRGCCGCRSRACAPATPCGRWRRWSATRRSTSPSSTSALPRIDGIELLRKLRSRRRDRPLPAIVLTGDATLERAVAALRVEALDFLQKAGGRQRGRRGLARRDEAPRRGYPGRARAHARRAAGPARLGARPCARSASASSDPSCSRTRSGRCCSISPMPTLASRKYP